MFKLAWRNIWRKRGRSFFTALAMALVVIFTTMQTGLFGAITNALFTSLVNTGGHLQIHPEDYRDARDFSDTLIRNVGQIEENLAGVLPPNTDLVSVLQTGGLLEGNNGRSRGIALIGIAQPDNLRATFMEDYLTEGKFPEDGDVESITLGINLAKSLKVALGDTVYMYASNTEGYGAAAYTVVGLLDIPNSQALAYTSLLAAQELAAPDAVSRLELHFNDFTKVSDDAKLPLLKTQLANAIGSGYSLETWDQVNPTLKGFLDSQAPISSVFQLVFFILAGLVVMNTIYLSIIERVREFGVMMALGLSRFKVMLMVFYESLFLCGVGALMGGIIVSLILWRTSKGITVTAFQAIFEGFPDTLYTTVSTKSILITLGFVLITGVLAALWPARTAGRLEPVEAMRFTA
jgi:ABC-type lipoprotein release transport system permease subunit